MPKLDPYPSSQWSSDQSIYGSVFDHSPRRKSHGRTATTSTSTSVGSSSLFHRIMGSSSCFHSKNDFSSSSFQKPLGRREPAETSLTNEKENEKKKKKKKLGIDLMKDETFSNRSLHYCIII